MQLFVVAPFEKGVKVVVKQVKHFWWLYDLNVFINDI